MTDAEWRRICRKGHHHFYSGLLDEILQCRNYNEHFDRFKKLGHERVDF